MDKSPEITSLEPMRPMRTEGSSLTTSTMDSNVERVNDTKSKLFAKLTNSASQQLIVSKPQTNQIQFSDTIAKTISPPTNAKQSNTSDLNSQTAPEQLQLKSKSDMTDTSSNNGAADKTGLDNLTQNQEDIVFSGSKNRWYTNEEVASILTSFGSHPEWQTNELKLRPKSGAVMLYSREKVRYRQDGYCWKKRKNGRTTREDHMKLKVQGIECIYGCYVHSALLPTFHRRCYWLLQNPDIVLVHYLNQPPDDQNKMVITFDSGLLEADTRRSWTNEEIIEEIGSVFGGISQIKHTLNINYSSSTIALQRPLPGATASDTSDLANTLEPCQQTGNISNTTAVNNMTIMDRGAQEKLRDDDEKNHSNSSLMSDESMGVSQDEVETVVSVSKNDINNNDVAVKDSVSEINQADYGQKQKQEDWIGQDREMTKAYNSNNQNNNNDKHENIPSSINGQNQQCQLVKLDNEFGFNHPIRGVSFGEDREDDQVSVLHTQSVSGSSHEDHNNGEKLDSCSPVTQIYNKIVDDIESYALPLGENQFNAPSNLGDDQHNRSHLMIDMPIDQQHHHGRHALDTHHHHHHHHHHHLQAEQYNPHQQTDQQLNLNCEKTTNQSSHYATTIDPSHDSKTSMSTNQQQQSCSMDLTPCDIFGDAPLAVEDEVQRNSTNEDASSIMIDNTDGTLLMNDDFNCLGTSHHSLPSHHHHQMGDDMGTGVVDSGLVNLISDSSTKGCLNINDRSSHLLIESKFPELFNYKPIGLSQRQQSDAKSSTSDTDTMNRLSPICLMAPRCNSTDNGMQASGHPCSFLSSVDQNFVRNNTDLEGGYLRLHNPLSDGNDCKIGDSDCSPSSTSIHASSSAQCHVDHLGNQMQIAASSQRCRSDQKDSSVGFGNIMLPKALSLDGSDLPSVNHRRLSTASAPHYHATHYSYNGSNQLRQLQNQNNNKQQNLLLMPSNTTYLHLQSLGASHYQAPIKHSNHFVQQRPSAPSLSLSVSPTNIPMKNSSEILVNSGLVDLQTESIQQQQQQSGHTYPQQSLCYPTQQQPQSDNTTMQQQQQQRQQLNKQNGRSTGDLVPILDYVPNHCSTSGGAKVLIIGNWSSLLNKNVGRHKDIRSSTSSKPIQHSTLNDNSDELNGFFALFDNLLVSATLIQDNVLKCYAPSHEPGFITLKVLYMNRIVSDQVFFEMRPSCAHLADSYQKLDQYRTGTTGNNNNNNISNSNHSSKVETSSYELNNHSLSDTSNNYSGPSNTNNNNNNNTSQAKNTSSSMKTSDTSGNGSRSANQKLLSSRSFTSETNSKVLALAENIISAMHKKNSVLNRLPDNISRLTNSLDIDLSAGLNARRNRLNASRGLHGYMNGSRSLSRESEPPTLSPYYTTNLDGLIDSDPYWHQSSYEPTMTDFRQQHQSQQKNNMQPLSVITDFNQAFGLPTTFDSSSGYVLSRKRHSSSSAGFLSTSPCQQRASHSQAARPSLNGSMNQWPLTSATVPSSAQTYPAEHPNNCTETSSSGLGSVVSSLSPSTSSLHSPSSTLAATGIAAGSGLTPLAPLGNQIAHMFDSSANRKQSDTRANDSGELSPTCSCGRQSSGTPTSADFCEYFQASAKTEKSFASLTLNDVEQQELYEAAKVIQKAYRTYRGRKRQASELLISVTDPNIATTSSSFASNRQSADDCLNSSNMMCVDGGEDYDIVAGCSQFLGMRCSRNMSSTIHDEHQAHHHHNLNQVQVQTNSQVPTLVKCYHDREMQAATIIQACYRRYRQYVNFKRQQASRQSGPCNNSRHFHHHHIHHQQQQASQQISSTAPPTANKTATSEHQQQQQQQQSQYGSSMNAAGNIVATSAYWPQSAQVVIETLPIVIDKAASSHVDRKRFKTASLINESNGMRMPSGAADPTTCESGSTATTPSTNNQNTATNSAPRVAANISEPITIFES